MVLSQSGYGIALLFNSGSPFLRDQTAIYRNVLRIVEGTHQAGAPSHVTTPALDAVLGCLTVGVLALGARGGLASRRWARRHSHSHWGIPLALLPPVTVPGLIAAVPAIVGHLTGGRDVTWVTAAYSWPGLVVFLVAALIAAASTLIARSWQLSRHGRDLANVPGPSSRKAPTLNVSSQRPMMRSHP